nr:hypothetical protein BaRGS_035281 [Batillaria attramentaria]
MYLLAYAQVNESPDDDECLKYITRRVNVDTKHILAWFAYYREVIEPNCPRVSYYSSLLNLVDRLLDTGTFSVEDISVFIS